MNLRWVSPAQVLNTVFWLGKAANGVASYGGPALNLKEFEGLLAQMKVVSGGSRGGVGVGGGGVSGCKGVTRQKTNTFVFVPPRLLPISGRDQRGTERGLEEMMIGFARILLRRILLFLMQDQGHIRAAAVFFLKSL